MNKVKIILVTIGLLLFVTLAAQPTAGGGTTITAAPLDGGLTALLIAGAVYGGKKLLKKQKEK